MTTVNFTYLTGLKRKIFRNARLKGSWDPGGRHSNFWSETPMTETQGDDGCHAFSASVKFDRSGAGRTFRWGVVLDGPSGVNVWGLPTEIQDGSSTHRYREFILPTPGHTLHERYHLTYCRRLGAQKHGREGKDIRFSLWAPNAQKVNVVFGLPDRGYISDDGTGIDPTRPILALRRGADGFWHSEAVPDFKTFENAPYMFQVQNAQGKILYRTDIYSRWQLGRGGINPRTGNWRGNPKDLDGTVSCSVVIDPDRVRKYFEPPAAQPVEQLRDEEFWNHEFTPGLPVPASIQDLVIYELHLGSLGFGSKNPGRLADAMAFLDHLVALGINAIELLPTAEFSGDLSWGYGDTHPLVIESSAGGRDKYKHFVRDCHRRGIAVIQDVVYNHYDHNAERAQWQYDSEAPEENIYYWYEGKSSDHARPEGGYLNNGSSGYTPRFWEEPVRRLFVSSAAQLIEEFHVDGLRVDLTQAIHRDNSLNATGWSITSANLFGQKFLREWSSTLRLIRPSVMLIAEDHSGWSEVTRPAAMGGLGFNAIWDADFYHGLIGDADAAGSAARLLREAGFGDNRPLAMDSFSGALQASALNRIVYHESHDEAGNARGSMRTIQTAVNGADLAGATRWFAEARSRVVFGLSALSAGTPMFFMGEEIGARKLFRYNNILQAREDFDGERASHGSKLFRFYQDLIRLRLRHAAIRSRSIDVIHAHNGNRVLAFTRRDGTNELLIVASLNDAVFPHGYVLQTQPVRLPSGMWREIFNSDSNVYGGSNLGNFGAEIFCENGRINVVLPSNGFVVFLRH